MVVTSLWNLLGYCHFLNNTADDGGAVVITDYHTSISHSRFTNNSAQKKPEEQ